MTTTPTPAADRAHMWRETAHPANQWIKNTLGARRAQMEVIHAGQAARAYVWAGLTPDLTKAQAFQEAAKAATSGRPDVAQAIMRGWANHR